MGTRAVKQKSADPVRSTPKSNCAKAYGNTLTAERRKAGLAGEHQRGFTIAHDGVAVGK